MSRPNASKAPNASKYAYISLAHTPCDKMRAYRSAVIASAEQSVIADHRFRYVAQCGSVLYVVMRKTQRESMWHKIFGKDKIIRIIHGELLRDPEFLRIHHQITLEVGSPPHKNGHRGNKSQPWEQRALQCVFFETLQGLSLQQRVLQILLTERDVFVMQSSVRGYRQYKGQRVVVIADLKVPVRFPDLFLKLVNGSPFEIHRSRFWCPQLIYVCSPFSRENIEYCLMCNNKLLWLISVSDLGVWSRCMISVYDLGVWSRCLISVSDLGVWSWCLILVSAAKLLPGQLPV